VLRRVSLLFLFRYVTYLVSFTKWVCGAFVCKGMRPCPPDAKPYMGRVPGWSGAYINAGHNCWGIAWAPACGKALAELVLEGSCSSMNLAPFDPARFTTLRDRGGRGRKKGSVNVGEQW
jgi:glycine/D-amino acid oxidase-like deaminating enzyme